MSRIPTIIDNPDGSVRSVNLKRLNEMPFFLLANPPRNVITVPANQSSPPIIMSISGEGPAQVFGMTLRRFPTAPAVYPTPLAVGRMMLQIQDGQSMRGLMNGAIHVDTIFSNYTPGNKAYLLPEALYVDEQRSIVVSFTDLSGVENNFRPSLECQRLLTIIPDHSLARARARMDKRQYLALPYFYTFDNGVTNLAGGGTNQETITIGQDHHFEIFQLTAVFTGAFSINIVNTATGESIIDMPLGTNAAVANGMMIGTASFPFKFHEPIFCETRTRLLVTLTDLSAAPNQIYLTLGGRVLADRMWR